MTRDLSRPFHVPADAEVEFVETEDVIFHGEPLSDARVDQIVADVRRANLIPGGKSLNGDGTHARALSVRLPDDVRAKVEEIAAARGIRASKLVREVLTAYVAESDPDHRKRA